MNSIQDSEFSFNNFRPNTSKKIFMICIVILVCCVLCYYYYFMNKKIYNLETRIKNKNLRQRKIQTLQQQEPQQETQTRQVQQVQQVQQLQQLPQIQVSPIIRQPIQPILVNYNDYQIVGSLSRIGKDKDTAKYKILPVYGKPYKGGFYKYYIEYKTNSQIFRMLISKNFSSTDMSRELYDGDIINVAYPISGSYKFNEQRADLFADGYSF